MSRHRTPCRAIPMLIFLFTLILTLHGLIGYSQNPSASFVQDINVQCIPMTVMFTNTSSNATSFFWDFGNGNTSTLLSPSNVYLTAGVYDVKLIATNSGGVSDTIIMVGAVSAIDQPVAGYYVQNTSSCLVSNAIDFINTTTQSSYWLWDFGDGFTSTNQNPIHSYSFPGNYSVTLIAGNADSCESIMTRTGYITIYADWNAIVNVDVYSTCDLNHNFQFSTPTPGVISCLWDFGDGATSNLLSPTHIYGNPGSYTISLSSINADGCTDMQVMNDLISIDIGDPGIITAGATSSCQPLTTTFVDSSTSSLSWLWDFGDGTSDTARYPSHTYIDSGVFDVTLTITNTTGCDVTTIAQNFINVQPLPSADFQVSSVDGCAPVSAFFVNQSVNASSWNWDFGDGFTSTQASPSHLYNAPGYATVTLSAYSNNVCVDTETKVDLIEVLNPTAKFSVNAEQGCVPLEVGFIDSSLGATQWLWLFGDGITSTLQNPTHEFQTGGSFDVALVVGNTFGCVDTFVYNNPIVASLNSPSYVAPPPYSGCAPFSIGFEDNSPDAIGWNWDYGDGSNTDTNRVVSHVYTYDSTYTVSVLIKSNFGCYQHIPNYATFIIETGEADFDYDLDICDPTVVMFSDSSENAVTWNWDFGDNTTSNMKDPIHIYRSFGRYIVKLQISTSNGCVYEIARMIKVMALEPMGEPYFIALDTIYPMTLEFYANTPSAIAWEWDFGDSTYSTLENPMQIFSQLPQASVSLVVSDGTCIDTLYIHMPSTVSPGISFGTGGGDSAEAVMASPSFVNGCVPFQIQFQNEFQNSTLDFGDGTTTTDSDPTHTYTLPGSYDLTEIGINDSGVVDTLILVDYIAIGGVVAEFTTSRGPTCDSIDIIFSDQSINATQWDWTFGDGMTSTDQNPYNSYPPVNTTYAVSLTVMDTLGCSDYRLKNVYTGFDEPQFEYATSACLDDTLAFSSSLQDVATWNWDFGDGISSSDSLPKHVYTSGGTYGILLNIIDQAGCALQFEMTDSIQVKEPVADFLILSNVEGCDTVDLAFDNTSTDATSYYWNFGDGSVSSLAVPGKQYTNPGQYSISLTATNEGCTSQMTMLNIVEVHEAIADFAFVQNDFCIPITVDLSDSSVSAVSWLWDFGDSTSSLAQSAQNPVYTFLNVPSGDISLTIVDSNGCTANITKPNISVLEADFTLNAAEGCAPFTNSFNDMSTNAVAWTWDFGDGESSTNSAPAHTYRDTGTFSVQLVVESSTGCFDTLSMDDAVAVHKPVARFASATVPDCAPLLVSFQDSSVDAAFYHWSFGDSSGSSNINPGHIYVLPGIYTVGLEVTDSFGCSDTLVEQAFVQVLGPIADANASLLAGCEGIEVFFTDASSDAAYWSWSFGDGYASSSANPSHLFDDPGNYTISLIVEDTIGCTSLYVLDDSISVYPIPEASFTSADSVACSPYLSSLTNNSTGADTYFWSFDDGETSTMTTPVHQFNAGDFEISLIAATDFGCADTSTFNLLVPLSPSLEFSSNTVEGCYPLAVEFQSLLVDTIDPDFSWQVGDSIYNVMDPTLTVAEIGAVDVVLTVTNSNGCEVTLEKEDFINVSDTLPPAGPTVTLVTVRSNTSIKVVWEEVELDDFAQYRVLRKESDRFTYATVAQLFGQDVIEYIDQDVNTLIASYCYMIQTIDICGNESKIEDLISHCSIEVSSITYADKVEVNWKPYAGCSIGVYEIYRLREDDSTYFFMGAVDSSINAFTDTSIICPDRYSYRIAGTTICGGVFRSFSDTTTAGPIENRFAGQSVDIIRSTVLDNSFILTEWAEPEIEPAYVAEYDIFRSSDNGAFIYLSTVGTYNTYFMDHDVDVSEEKYLYKIEVKNICEVKNDAGKEGSSILLKGDVVDYFPVLEWSPYQGWKAGVEYYKIEKLNAQGEWEMIKKVPSTERRVVIEN